ncbi:SEC12-like protein 2 [Raphanus sativus]|nr:SEC12-like protein 2 [Raphanus sativus]
MANTQTYGPIFAAHWIPEETGKENSEDGCESSTWTSRSCIALAGGGGDGGHMIPNVIVICRVYLETNSLLEQPVGRVVVTGLPYYQCIARELQTDTIQAESSRRNDFKED